ncbi:MAG: BREX-2 system adenine-specific DNA-methyltransferase PglX [Planctomycetota bacterium]
MAESQRLLDDLQAEVDALQDDIRRRADEVREFDTVLRTEYAAAVRAHRTAETFESWREEPVTQAAVAWVLGTVFVRFLEDNGLIDPRLSGSPERRRIAIDKHGAYFQQHPLETDREYLLEVFREVGALPAGELFDARHNPLWRLTPSGDGAKRLLDFWQRIQPATGSVAHTFDDATWDTRILGDLYQDLSESARKRYALLQTPRFVEAFILDRTLTPAVETFGYRETTVIDPTCGSGHFLLGAFDRLLALHETNEPAVNAPARVKRVLEQIAGVDLNPFATAIARFRLLLAAMRTCRISKLASAPAFEINVATGDSLLHGHRFSDTSRGMQMSLDPDDPSHHHFAAEDERVDRVLGRQYHAVVGNPPYITVKDRALNALYRQRYGSCHMKYALVAPFTERFFELAYRADESKPAGYVGMIVANSFMKREFGSKLIEECLGRVDLTHVIDTSGAYIPGHGTPTVVLFGRNREHGDLTRTVMGIRGEPSAPQDPSKGQVWSAILTQTDLANSEGPFITVRDLAQESLHSHPWSIGGGGAAELKDRLDDVAQNRLEDVVKSIGFMAITGEDDAYVVSTANAARDGLPCRPFQVGDGLRDWSAKPQSHVLFPYQEPSLQHLEGATLRAVETHLWPLRRYIGSRSMFGRTAVQHANQWFSFMQFIKERASAPLLIAFAEVATHNHFVLDRGGRVFKHTAPVIKLPAEATENDYYALLGLLNSSTSCFWFKQVCMNKGSTVDEHGARQRTAPFEDFYQLNATKVAQCPVVPVAPERAKELSELALTHEPTRADWEARVERQVSIQEELDWEVYRAFGLCGAEATCDAPARSIKLGHRAFEIVMARRMAGGDLETTWFERHGSTPTVELPTHWPEDYRRLVERRIELIENDRNIGLLEQPEYKRRWNLEPWNDQQVRLLRERLLDRLESSAYWSDPQLTTIARLADISKADDVLPELSSVSV